MQFAPLLDRLEIDDNYQRWLIEKQNTGIYTLLVSDFFMIGFHVFGFIFGNPSQTSYVVVAAGVSFVYGIIADLLTWDYNLDLNRYWLAERSWYLQIANFVLTIVAGLLSLIAVFTNVDLVFILSICAVGTGVIGGITGAIYDIATLELWNYFEFDYVDPNFVNPYREIT
jgi:hypothetical protein